MFFKKKEYDRKIIIGPHVFGDNSKAIKGFQKILGMSKKEVMEQIVGRLSKGTSVRFYLTKEESMNLVHLSRDTRSFGINWCELLSMTSEREFSNW